MAHGRSEAPELTVFQLEKQNRPGKNQRDGVGRDERNIPDYDPVCKPKQDSDDEYREHHQRYVFCRTRAPRFNHLRQERSGRAECGQ